MRPSYLNGLYFSIETTKLGTKFYNEESEDFILVFTFAFMVLTNIMFINLLIAVFK